jgi:hypothetical protein
MDNDKNLEKSLNKLNKEFESSLRNNARIKTGFLKDSIKVKDYDDKNDMVVVDLAEYGQFRRPWYDEQNYMNFFDSYYKNKYEETIKDAYGDDIIDEVNNEVKLKGGKIKRIK